jgi:hypothetical protein
MTWKPSADFDREIRRWMKANGWEVTRTNYDFEREIYAWRHDMRGGASPTLRIARKVLIMIALILHWLTSSNPSVGMLLTLIVALPLGVLWSMFLLPYGLEFVFASSFLEVKVATTPTGRHVFNELSLPAPKGVWMWLRRRGQLVHSASYAFPESIRLMAQWIRETKDRPLPHPPTWPIGYGTIR